MNSKIFKKRLRCLYTIWKKHKHRIWGGSDVLIISTLSDNSIISNHFHLCLFGYIFPDTITIFTFKEIHFICNNNSSSPLKDLTSSSKEAVGAHVIIHENQNDDANTLIRQILSKLQNQHDSPLIVGHVFAEGEEESMVLGKNEFQIVDIKNGLSKFAVLAQGLEENLVESVFWGFKHDQARVRVRKDSIEGDFDIYLQELSKEAEEMILLADVKRVDMNTLRRRRKKVEEIDEKDEFDDVSEWVIV